MQKKKKKNRIIFIRHLPLYEYEISASGLPKLIHSTRIRGAEGEAALQFSDSHSIPWILATILFSDCFECPAETKERPKHVNACSVEAINCIHRNLFLISPRTASTTPLQCFNFLFYADLYLYLNWRGRSLSIVHGSTGGTPFIMFWPQSHKYDPNQMLELINLIAPNQKQLSHQSGTVSKEQMAEELSSVSTENVRLQIQIECNSSREKT